MLIISDPEIEAEIQKLKTFRHSTILAIPRKWIRTILISGNGILCMKKKEENCPFCYLKSDILTSNKAAIAFTDKYLVTKYHTLVTPLRHVASFFELGAYEYNACIFLINEVKNIIIKKDITVTGFNIGINDGIDAGQTIFHSHIHIIPRRNGDATNPRGGIRNIIPSPNEY